MAEETTGLTADVADMLSARVELARLEIDESIGQAKRTAMLGGFAVVLIIVGLGPLTTVAAELLATRTTLSPTAALLSVGGGLIALGIIAALAAWMSARRIRMMQQSIAEIREDVQWLRDLAGGR